MPDRDFDKSIQRKANELRLEPSPEVWEKVAAQIKEKDRRRGFAWYWLAAAMLAGGLSVWFLSPDLFKQSVPTTVTQSTTNDSNATPSVSITLENNNSKDIASAQQELPAKEETVSVAKGDPLKSSQPVITANKESENTSFSTETKSKNPTVREKLIAPTDRIAPTNKASYANKGENKQQRHIAKAEKAKKTAIATAPTEQPTQSPAIDEATEKELFGKTIAGNNNAPAPGEIEPNNKTAGDTKLNADLLAAVAKPSKTRAPWNLAMQIGGGSGSMRDGLTSPYSPVTENFSGSIALQPPGTATTLDPRPSDIKAGPSFQASIGVSKPINRKLNFITGIQYAYFSNRIEVGRKMDSSALFSNFRLQNIAATTAYTGAGNDGKAYYNAYHYLQVPVEIGWYLDNRKRFSWNNGFLFGVLLRTDALHYDQAAGAYYQNNDLVNKFQTSAQTSLNYRLFNLGTGTLSAGPFLNYQLSNIDKTAGNKRLLTVGLNARFLFNKQK
ncbi:PorT family protein [Flavihumibacter sp. RY-1]|uniref:PorT family protein n=1 Tax=Flavihumibacter fluminis TaxID=2909236 RepID=A0ABS9BFC3_9BACT|nr:outer membrane beta-barrel protein [Flavihumibacter fluminis]MCF1713366.1 PorT family protein [Flavihumibacter fluminis]